MAKFPKILLARGVRYPESTEVNGPRFVS